MLAAEKLKSESFFASTVNRAYYSCLQYIFHILVEKLNYKPEDINQHTSGSHERSKRLIADSLYAICKEDKDKQKDYQWFQRKLPELKKARVKADYDGDVITLDEGHDAIRKATDLISLLKKYYRSK